MFSFELVVPKQQSNHAIRILGVTVYYMYAPVTIPASLIKGNLSHRATLRKRATTHSSVTFERYSRMYTSIYTLDLLEK